MENGRRRSPVVKALFVLLGAQVFVAVIAVLRYKVSRTERQKRAVENPFMQRTFATVQVDDAKDTINLIMSGSETIHAIIGAIDAAKQEVLVETFIWSDDEVGAHVRDALVRASDRGVRVCVIYDGLGSLKVSRTDGYFPSPIESFVFRPVDRFPESLRPSILFRDHRKIVTIDNQVAFCGGFNFGAQFIAWRDTHVRIDGPSVSEVRNAFVDFWNDARPSGVREIDNGLRRDWDPHLTVHRNDPSLAIFPIRGMYMEAIDRAAERIWITNAYFVPDRAFKGALATAAERGVDVRVMLPHHSNHPLTDVLANRSFDRLLSAGVRFFHFCDHMVHAKTATIDGTWSTVGTANLDRWSMLGNFEVNIEVRGASFARQMEEMFEIDMANCVEIDLEKWRKRPAYLRFGERIVRSLSPLL